jgi:hypothetical protein
MLHLLASGNIYLTRQRVWFRDTDVGVWYIYYDCIPLPPVGVPTLTQWGIIAMAVVFLGMLVTWGLLRQRRRTSYN